MSVNFFGVVHTTSAFLPLLRRGSKKQIILLSSGLASIKMDFGFGPAISAYSISKTALNGYARKLSDAIKPVSSLKSRFQRAGIGVHVILFAQDELVRLARPLPRTPLS